MITPDHRYFVNGRELPGNTAVLRASGYGHGYGTDDDLVRGKHVHEAARLFDLGRLDWTTVRPAIGPYVSGWAAFIRVSGFVPKLVEVPMLCKRHGFATRPDRVGILNGRWAVVQIKSGAADPSVGPQTAGEALAAEERIRRPLERFVVVLPGNGWFRLRRLASRADRPAFLAALATWNNRRRQGWNGKPEKR